jgi:hypothetical protein
MIGRVMTVACMAAALSLAWCAGGCSSNPREGYAFSPSYREDIRSVSVPMWKNDTYSYGLEAELTAAITSEIQRATPWRVTDPEAAQTSLTGRIVSVELRRVTTGRDTGLVETQAVEITVEFEWRDNRTGRALVARRGFRASENFVPAGEYRERLAVGENAAIQRLARDVVGELRSSW